MWRPSWLGACVADPADGGLGAQYWSARKKPAVALQITGIVGDLVAVDRSAEVSRINEGNWVTEKIHSIGDATGFGPADHEYRVSVSFAFAVQLLGDEPFGSTANRTETSELIA